MSGETAWPIGDGSEYVIRLMHETDVPPAILIEKEVGWNNLAYEAEWRIFFDNNSKCCLAAVTKSGVLVGTTVGAISDDKKFGGIAVVMVTATHRHHGICEALVRKANEILISQGVSLLGLDGSAMGYPIYKRIGFVDQNIQDRLFIAANFATALDHLSRSELDNAKLQVAVAGLPERKLLAKCDAFSFGADRTSMITSTSIFRFGFMIPSANTSGHAEGLLCREGAQALHIGPIYAHSEHSLRLLLAALCLSAPKSLMNGVQVYIPDTAASYSISTFKELGFEEWQGIHFRRMRMPVPRGAASSDAVAPATPAPFCCAVIGCDMG
ncbi:hypothetical protein Pelo_4658 [Pelomyxa schiedti]|nr:hypothetical protein Pelo_4658 [Pelomyxa schiedti]